MSQSQFASLFADSCSLLREVHHVEVLFKYREQDADENWRQISAKPEQDGGYADPLRRKADADTSARYCDFIIPIDQLTKDSRGEPIWPGRESVIYWKGKTYRASLGGLEDHHYSQGEGHEANTIRFFTVEVA